MKPKLSAIIIAKTVANTDVAPFIPHAQGIIELSIIFIPIGNGIPINNPRGANSKTDKVILIKDENWI